MVLPVSTSPSASAERFGTGDSYLQLFHDTFDGTKNSVEGCGAQSLVWEPYPY